MVTKIDKLMQTTCNQEQKEKICRSRGGESCAFDGAMIVLQPIADTAHIVHGPISCCGNSWEGRGTLSSKGRLHRMGFTTDMDEVGIVFGSEDKLLKAIIKTYESVRPKAIFVHATCVSGLIGEDIDAVCKKAEKSFGIRVIPVNAPGFVGPKNLGNRIAGEVLLDYVIGTGEPSNPSVPTLLKGGEGGFINLIGEYNIAGDLWLVEPILKEAGIKILSKITGDSTFEEITYAHKARLNVVVCSRALINLAIEMEKRYGIPYIEVSFFGKTEMSRALRLIASKLRLEIQDSRFKNSVEEIIDREEKRLIERLKAYEHLKGKKAVLYTGGVKSWSFISALMDLGIEIVAAGTKKSSFEDEEKMKEILGPDAPLIEDVTPKNLLKIIKERDADILIAGGRNQYLAIKEGIPFVDVNQERHIAYAGYEGLINLAEQISNSLRFYSQRSEVKKSVIKHPQSEIVINPLKHSQSIGAAIAFQGIDRSLPIIHGAQGCAFLAKVLLTKHFREPIALASTKLFTEDVVMGSEERLINTVKGFIEKNKPEVIGILTSGLSEVKGDDVKMAIKNLNLEIKDSKCQIINVPTPDYEGGLESGYSKAVEAIINSLVQSSKLSLTRRTDKALINILVGSHLTPADFTELREIIESFGLRSIVLPDLSALDGSRVGFSALATGGTKVEEIREMGNAEFTIAIGASMENPAKVLKERFGVEYMVFDSVSGLRDTDLLMETLSLLSGEPIPSKYERQKRILVDSMRDAHFYYGGKRVCLALDTDLAIQTSHWLSEMGAIVELAVIPHDSPSMDKILAKNVVVGDFFSIKGKFDLLISNSHAEDTAKKLGVPLYQMGFPVYKVLGYTNSINTGYKGTLYLINDIANLFMEG